MSAARIIARNAWRNSETRVKWRTWRGLPSHIRRWSPWFGGFL